MIFCDTSTFAKYYVLESGTPKVRRLFGAGAQVHVSELVRVEVMSVFHRLFRDGKLTQSGFVAIRGQFDADNASGLWTWLPVTSVITKAAAETFATLPPSVFLRASDCIHLVTALHHNFDTIHTHDIHQAAAAITLGLKTITL